MGQYVGNPSQAAVYQILYTCIAELTRRGVVMDSITCLSLRELQLSEMKETAASKPSLMLWDLAGKCVGLSGRSVRKIAFLALALFSPVGEGKVLRLIEFVNSL